MRSMHTGKVIQIQLCLLHVCENLIKGKTASERMRVRKKKSIRNKRKVKREIARKSIEAEMPREDKFSETNERERLFS